MPKTANLWALHQSPIHRKGMFARVDIPAGTAIIEYIGERIDKDESLERCLEQEKKGDRSGGAKVYIFDLNEEWDLDGNVPNNPAKYINHSCEENCEALNEADRIWIYAKKDIAEGEELTFDYGYDIEYYEDHPCECGSRRCCGYIVAKSQRRELKQRLAEIAANERQAEKERRTAEAKVAKEKARKAAQKEKEKARKAAEREKAALEKKKAAAKKKEVASKKKVALKKKKTPSKKATKAARSRRKKTVKAS